MKKILFIISAFFVFGITSVMAADRPKVYTFDKYGLPYYSSIEEYQKFVGKTVMYVPEYAPSYSDQYGFSGKFNTPYVISKIKGKDNRMTLYLKEKNGKAKTKMVINNRYEYEYYTLSNKYDYYNHSHKLHYITEEYTVPLLLVEDIEQDRNNIIGKKYPHDSNISKFVITDIKLHNFEKSGYPTVCYEIKRIGTDKKIYEPVNKGARLDVLGNIYTNDKVKASYEVVGLLPGVQVVKNSITLEEKEVLDFRKIGDKYVFASDLCFEDDLSGRYNATLSKVEKPENPNIRYGETKEIVDKNITKYSYIDSHIAIIILATSTQFEFTLKNISESSLKVVWNEAVFVDSDGSTSKIMHAGTKYLGREGDQPATTIIKGAMIDDLASPTKNVRYSDELETWVTDSMFPSEKALVVKPIRLMLPIQIKDVINEYIFEFEVNYIFNYPDRIVSN